MSDSFLLFDVSMIISHVKFISGKSGHTHTTPVSHGSSWLINGFSYMTKTWLIMIVLEIKQKHASCKAKKIKMC